MTKCVATHKNMADGREQDNVEEGATVIGATYIYRHHIYSCSGLKVDFEISAQNLLKSCLSSNL